MKKFLKALGLLRASDQTLQFGEFQLRLPHDHLLPLYRRKHPGYDRFLPFLAGSLPAGCTVIDVGANCGDTVVAMAAQNRQLHYLCIEPAAVFQHYLQNNVAVMRQMAPGMQIETVAAMVGKEITQAKLAGENGSKHAVLGAGGMATTTLDVIFESGLRPPVRLLKSDVDGFDYDVVRSAEGLIARYRPLIFYECQFFDDAQRNGFDGLITDLTQWGYSHWTVFDNFGEAMLCGAEATHVRQLMDYSWRQQHGGATRTVYYYDVLAAVGADAPFIERVLADYSARD